MVEQTAGRQTYSPSIVNLAQKRPCTSCSEPHDQSSCLELLQEDEQPISRPSGTFGFETYACCSIFVFFIRVSCHTFQSILDGCYWKWQEYWNCNVVVPTLRPTLHGALVILTTFQASSVSVLNSCLSLAEEGYVKSLDDLQVDQSCVLGHFYPGLQQHIAQGINLDHCRSCATK